MKIVQLRIFFWSVFSRIRTEYGDLFCKSSYSVRKRENTDQKKLRIWSLFRQWKDAQIIDEETHSEFQKVAICAFTALVKIEFFVGVFLKILQIFLIHFKRAFWKTQFFWSAIFWKQNYVERANICSRSLVEATGQRSGIFTLSYRINSLSLQPCA